MAKWTQLGSLGSTSSEDPPSPFSEAPSSSQVSLMTRLILVEVSVPFMTLKQSGALFRHQGIDSIRRQKLSNNEPSNTQSIITMNSYEY